MAVPRGGEAEDGAGHIAAVAHVDGGVGAVCLPEGVLRQHGVHLLRPEL